MKIRNGFVSNSSSSSFIFTAPKDLKEVPVTFKVFLYKKLDTLEELIQYIEQEYYWRDHTKIDDICANDKSVEEIYEIGKKTIEGGQSFVVMNLSSEGDPLSCLFYEDSSALTEAVEQAGCTVIRG